MEARPEFDCYLDSVRQSGSQKEALSHLFRHLCEISDAEDVKEMNDPDHEERRHLDLDPNGSSLRLISTTGIYLQRKMTVYHLVAKTVSGTVTIAQILPNGYVSRMSRELDVPQAQYVAGFAIVYFGKVDSDRVVAERIG